MLPIKVFTYIINKTKGGVSLKNKKVSLIVVIVIFILIAIASISEKINSKNDKKNNSDR